MSVMGLPVYLEVRCKATEVVVALEQAKGLLYILEFRRKGCTVMLQLRSVIELPELLGCLGNRKLA